MKFNEEDLQQDLMDLIQEREKYRMLALKYKEAMDFAVEHLKSMDSYSIVYGATHCLKQALKAGEDV